MYMEHESSTTCIVNWKLNHKKSISAYKHKWSKREGDDLCVLNEWGWECVDRRIQLLRRKYINM